MYMRKDQFTQVSLVMENLEENSSKNGKKNCSENCISEWRQNTNTKIVKFIQNKSEPRLLVNETTIVSKIREIKNYVDHFNQNSIPEIMDCSQNRILVFGGIDPNVLNSYDLDNYGKDVLSYNYRENDWEIFSNMPGSKHHHSATFCNKKILIIGGARPPCNNSKPVILKSVWCFNYHSLEWTSETNLPSARRDFGLVSTKNGFYIIGGENTMRLPLSSMFYYDMKNQTWTKKPPLHIARAGLSCTIIGQQIWVAGGLTNIQNKITITNTMESYDIKTEQWREIGVLRKPRCFARMTVINNTDLYIVGGLTLSKDGNFVSLPSIDKYCFQKKNWKKVINMSTPRHGHDVIAINKKIFILGGVTITNDLKLTLDSVECFSCDENKWIKGIKKLPTPLSGFSAITIPNTI